MALVAPVVLPRALRNARLQAGMSQADLAKRSGLSTGYVAMIELGKRHPRTATVMALAAALGCAVDTFALVGDR